MIDKWRVDRDWGRTQWTGTDKRVDLDFIVSRSSREKEWTVYAQTSRAADYRIDPGSYELGTARTVAIGKAMAEEYGDAITDIDQFESDLFVRFVEKQTNRCWDDPDSNHIHHQIALMDGNRIPFTFTDIGHAVNSKNITHDMRYTQGFYGYGFTAPKIEGELIPFDIDEHGLQWNYLGQYTAQTERGCEAGTHMGYWYRINRTNKGTFVVSHVRREGPHIDGYPVGKEFATPITEFVASGYAKWIRGLERAVALAEEDYTEARLARVA